MKTPEQRGPIGAWAYSERTRRDWSIQEVVEQMARANTPISDSYLRSIEGGSKPASPRILKALERIYSSQPPDTEKERAGDMPALIEALREQTAAINALVETVGTVMESQVTADEATVRAMVEALLRVNRRGGGPPPPQFDTPT